jgi:hypothetical protein
MTLTHRCERSAHASRLTATPRDQLAVGRRGAFLERHLHGADRAEVPVIDHVA